MTRKNTQPLLELMKQYGIQPSGALGQHILLDEVILRKISSYVHRSSYVLEIGAGPGNLTAILASRAQKVISVEMDRKFVPILENLAKEFTNIEFKYVDVLKLDLQKILSGDDRRWQLVANLPYHISEPFMRIIAGLPLENAVLMVGEKLARSLQQENLDSHEFTKTSLLATAFFDTQIAFKVHKSSFHPEPRTDSAVVILTPLTKEEYVSKPWLSIVRKLFLTERRNSTIARVIKEAIDEGQKNVIWRSKQASHLQFRVEELDVSSKILSTPFSRLSSEETRVFVKVLRKRFGL